MRGKQFMKKVCARVRKIGRKSVVFSLTRIATTLVDGTNTELNVRETYERYPTVGCINVLIIQNPNLILSVI